MFESENSLEVIRKSLSENSTPSPWKRLQDGTEKMSREQVSWTLSRPEVVKEKEALFEAFNGWLFERFKEEFSREKAYQPLIESYISVILSSAEAFGKRTRDLEEENERLRKELEELRNAG